jgi:hypothetical protein
MFVAPEECCIQANVAIRDHADDLPAIFDDRQYSTVVFPHQFRVEEVMTGQDPTPAGGKC